MKLSPVCDGMCKCQYPFVWDRIDDVLCVYVSFEKATNETTFHEVKKRKKQQPQQQQQQQSNSAERLRSQGGRRWRVNELEREG